MIAIEEVDALSKEKLPLITVVTGDDLGQYSQLKQLFLERVAFDPSDLAYSYFDFPENSFVDAQMDLESLPFFSDEKVVIFDNLLDLTTAKKSYLDDRDAKSLEAYLTNPVETTRLVIFAPGKLDGKRRLVKLLKREGKIFEASQLKEADLRTHFQKVAHQAGLVFAKGAFEQLLIKSNFDFSEIQKNLAFLKAYKADGRIDQTDIDQAIPKTLQDNIFDLTQYILQGKIDQARDLVRDLRLQGEDEIKLIAIMLGQFRLFTQVKILAQAGKTESAMVAQLSELLGRKINPYQVKFALRDSRPLALNFLKQAMVILIETDYQIKQGKLDKAYLFDLALLKIASVKDA
ncbi:DNA polymerase III subunit delta [Streptococcus downei]|uniref:DNA polymerase III subunit delta n=1 Tax=Streptococcus downei MFe28 TaxID=764290 RepID=A0A380JES0_STRDO|nr:DNA polymerase III subunit delta [Streptococcus downei]EFQ56826.1 DNA polymerase III, delta subunit [Streptococcus downei F0415]SUN35907.1 DNA polymerase III subunit delta [Streptococcus downei MFe28]